MKGWKKLGEETAYQGWRSILKRLFELPNGKTEYFDIVANNNFVTVAALTKNRTFILVRQFRPGPEAVMTSFSEGYIEDGESPEDAAVRELLEETGYQAGSVEFLKARRSAYSTETCFCLLAKDCVRIAEQRLDPSEFIEVFEMSIPSFYEFLTNPETTFANTDCAFLALDRLGLLLPDQGDRIDQ